MALAPAHTLTLREAILHNNRAPILQSPQDILEIVFDLLAHSFTIDDASRAMLELTWVCRCWRKILLNGGRFWARVSSTIPASLFYEMLRRSSQAPLAVKTDASNLELTALIRRQLHRVREMVVVAEDNAFLGSGHHLPGLHTLVLDLQAAPAMREDDFFCEWTFLGLVSLTLSHASFRTNIRLLSPALTSLRLKSVHCNDAPGSVGAAFFFQSIGALKALRNLHLGQSIPLAGSDIALDHVYLPALQTLVLVDSLPLCMWFLEHVGAPALESLSLDLTARIGEEDLPEIPNTLQRMLHTPNTSSQPTISVHTTSFDVIDGRLCLSLYTRGSADAPILTSPTLQVIFYLKDKLCDALNLVACLPLRAVHSVWFRPRHTDMNSLFLWYGMTTVFSRARVLVLGETTYHSAAMFLGVANYTAGAACSPVFFPYLTALTLFDICPGRSDPSVFREIISLFVQSLKDRAVMGRPVTTVMIRQCPLLTKRDVFKIRQVVRNVQAC